MHLLIKTPGFKSNVSNHCTDVTSCLTRHIAFPVAQHKPVPSALGASLTSQRREREPLNGTSTNS